ncbi:MAG: Ig-like domain-containing protein [Thermoplasmata archaeon]
MRTEPILTAILGVVLIALALSPMCFHVEPLPEKLSSPDYEDTLDTTPPIILSTSPAHGWVVYPNVDIVIRFNESMNTSSFSYEFVSGWNPGMTWTWEGSVYENDTIRGSHAELFSSPTEYVFNVTYAEDLAGNSLAPGPVPNPWNWSTIVVIISTVPADGETNVDLYQDIIINFSGSVNTADVWIEIQPNTGGWVITWVVSDSSVIITPAGGLVPCTVYWFAVRNSFGYFPSLVPNPWVFSTVCPPKIIETNPSDGEVVNRPDLPINVTFTEPMNKTTVNWTINPHIDLTASWSQNDTHLTLSHTDDFNELTMYTVHVMQGEDVEGNSLVPGPVPNPWTFSTTCWGSYIVLTDPYDQETNVSTNRSISVLFNSCMNPLSLTWDIDPFIELTPNWSNGNTLLEFTHSGEFEDNTVYNMSVYVEDEYGNPLEPGPVPNPWSWTTGMGLPPPPPAPPRNITAYLSGPQLQDVTISWELSNDDPSGNVSRYDVYRGVDSYDASGGSYAYLASVPNGVSTYADQMVGKDAHSYYYLVCATNTNGSSCTENQAGKFTRALEAGPQLVSIPVTPLDASVESVLQTLNFDSVWYFDSLNQSWKSYSKWKSYSRQLEEILRTMGVWVNVTENSNLTVAGVVLAQTTVQLSQGWNLVSFPSFNSSYTVADLRAETGAIRVEGYSPSAPYFLRVLGDAEVLQAGYGYWMRVDADVDWIVEVS